jgi:hypothetical protein
VAIQGTEAALPPHRRVPKRVPIRVSFGEPIAVEPVDEQALRRKEALRLTGELRGQVAGILQAQPTVE